VHAPRRQREIDAALGTAQWLRSRGLNVLSVLEREGNEDRTPDAVIVGVPVTLEAKSTVATVNSIAQQIRSGRRQSRRVVVDGQQANAQLDVAQAGLATALRKYGQHLDEVVTIAPSLSGRSILWL
jgi:hypothetical protein